MAYFPMFVDIKKKKCLIVGGGTVALRKVQVLLDFGADVVVVAPEVISKIKEYPVTVYQRNFEKEDLHYRSLKWFLQNPILSVSETPEYEEAVPEDQTMYRF